MSAGESKALEQEAEVRVPVSVPPQLDPRFDGPRVRRPQELASVVDLINLVFRTENVAPGMPPRRPTMGTEWGHLYEPGNLDNIRVVVERGQVVSSLGIYSTPVRGPRGTLAVAQLNNVATHPDYRQHGLGSALLHDARRKMTADGHQIGLLGTRVQDYYRKFGWESAGKQRTFVFDRGNVGMLPRDSLLGVTDDCRRHAAEIHGLRQRHTWMAVSSLESFVSRAERKWPRIWVAQRGSQVAAYAAVAGAGVVEYGGALEDVGALLHTVFQRIDDPSLRTTRRAPGQRATPEMTVQTPGHDELAGWLLDLGIPHRLDYLGMIALFDTPGLLSALGIQDVTVQRVGEGWRICRGDRSLELGERELVKLLFGPERATDFAANLFPLEFYQWPLDQA